VQIRLIHSTHQVTVLPPHLSEAQPPRARIAPDGRSKKMVRNAAVAKRQAVFADVVLGQPQRQRHEPAEYEVVGQTEPPHPGVEQAASSCSPSMGRGRLLSGRVPFSCSGSAIGEEPEQHRHHHHRHGVDLGHHLPRAKGGNDQRSDELGQRGAGVARAENAHRRALPLLAEPGRGVGDADGERTAGQADEQAQNQVLPVFGRVGQEPGRVSPPAASG
jgi:hypothetical protein